MTFPSPIPSFAGGQGEAASDGGRWDFPLGSERRAEQARAGPGQVSTTRVRGHPWASSQVSVLVPDQVLGHGKTGMFEELLLQNRGVYFRIWSSTRVLQTAGQPPPQWRSRSCLGAGDRTRGAFIPTPVLYSHCTYQAGPFHVTKENSALPGPKKMRASLLGRLTAGSSGQRRPMLHKMRLEMRF